jgi:hypothetical protein
MRSGTWTFVPPGKERAEAIRSSVLISWNAVRLIRAIRTLLLIGGKTAMVLILRTYGATEQKEQTRLNGGLRHANHQSWISIAGSRKSAKVPESIRRPKQSVFSLERNRWRRVVGDRN